MVKPASLRTWLYNDQSKAGAPATSRKECRKQPNAAVSITAYIKWWLPYTHRKLPLTTNLGCLLTKIHQKHQNRVNFTSFIKRFWYCFYCLSICFCFLKAAVSAPWPLYVLLRIVCSFCFYLSRRFSLSKINMYVCNWLANLSVRMK